MKFSAKFAADVATAQKVCYNRKKKGEISGMAKEEKAKAAPAKAAETDKKEKTAAKTEEKKEAARNYHVAKRPDGKWQVKFAGGEKAIKLFSTQAEAIEYAKKLANNQDGSISIHKKDGKLRKQKY